MFRGYRENDKFLKVLKSLHIYFNLSQNVSISLRHGFPVDTGRKLNVHKTFRRCPGRLLNVLCTFNLGPVSTGFSDSFKWRIRCLQMFRMMKRRGIRSNLAYCIYIWNISNIACHKESLNFNLLFISKLRFHWVHGKMLNDTQKCLTTVLCTFNLRPVSTGFDGHENKLSWEYRTAIAAWCFNGKYWRWCFFKFPCWSLVY